LGGTLKPPSVRWCRCPVAQQFQAAEEGGGMHMLPETWRDKGSPGAHPSAAAAAAAASPSAAQPQLPLVSPPPALRQQLQNSRGARAVVLLCPRRHRGGDVLKRRRRTTVVRCGGRELSAVPPPLHSAEPPVLVGLDLQSKSRLVPPLRICLRTHACTLHCLAQTHSRCFASSWARRVIVRVTEVRVVTRSNS